MTEIPADVMNAARAMIELIKDEAYVVHEDQPQAVMVDGYVDFVALAQIGILAERERCAQFVEENTIISPHTGRWGFKKRKSPSMRARALAMGIRSGSK